MFARTSNVFLHGVWLAIAAVIALVFGGACKGPDCFASAQGSSCDYHPGTFAVFARGANVIPVPAPADTSARASATFNAATFAYTYTVQVAPSGTIDSIALYEGVFGQPLPASATAILCAGAAACAATSGTARVVAPATAATITTSMRAYGTQVVFFTTTAQKAAGGAMRGTMYAGPF
jgi:hypothetical protein